MEPLHDSHVEIDKLSIAEALFASQTLICSRTVGDQYLVARKVPFVKKKSSFYRRFYHNMRIRVFIQQLVNHN